MLQCGLQVLAEQPQQPENSLSSEQPQAEPDSVTMEEEEGEGGFMFVRHDSKRLSDSDADRVIEGLFVESRQPPNAPKQRRKLLHIQPDILSKEPQSPEESNKSFG